MEKIGREIFKKLYKLPKDSHKGQNGKLTIIGGSKLFHGASLWALKIASRIVDMVFYSTVEENVKLTKKLKSEIYDFIFVPRSEVEGYIEESDAVLIGPGLVRGSKKGSGTGESGKETKGLTRRLLNKFPEKKWIIDAGSLQMMSPEWLKSLKQVVITPHSGEFKSLFNIKYQISNIKYTIKNSKFKQSTLNQNKFGSGQAINNQQSTISDLVCRKAKEYGCIIVLKGPTDIVCSPERCVYNTTGNEGMTKGGTGDVLAGLIAALSCKNDLFLAACAGVYLSGLAGDSLYKKVGPYFNASDLCEEIPKVLKELMKY